MHVIGDPVREQVPTAVRRYRRWPWIPCTLVVGAILMFCYLRVAGATEVTSDGAGLVLQASEMLHGNLLLQGWWDTDVSFVTTELPEYMAVTHLAGVRPEVVHICAALTYTLLVLLAAFVAKGRARGARGVVRALLAAGVLLAPQSPPGPTTVLLGSPDHVGTAVPVLLLLLLLDRAPGPRSRWYWYIPAALGVCIVTAALLAWVIVGDPLAEVIGVIPLVLACLLRAVRITVVRIVRALLAFFRARRGVRKDGAAANAGAAAGAAAPSAAAADGADVDPAASDTSWRAVVFCLLLAAAAYAALPIARRANLLILRHHGYQLGPNLYGRLTWHVMVKNAPMIGQSVLALFGADYQGVTGTGNKVFALVHLAGVAVVIAAVLFAVWRLLVPARAGRAGDLIADFLVLAVGANIAAYFVFVQPLNIYSAHEIGPVASLAAALAGRMLGGPLLSARLAPRAPGRERRPRLTSRLPGFAAGRSRRPRTEPAAPRRGTAVLVPVLAAGLACYAVLLGIAATAPQGPPQNAPLAGWLLRHHLHSGLASYWEASSVAVESGGQLTLLAVGIHGWNRRLAPDAWETDVRLDNPAKYRANFVVAGQDKIVPPKLALEQFGPPVRTYHFETYTIMVYDKNLLGQLNPISPPA